MAHSYYTARIEARCPHCRTSYGVDGWLIIDLVERPDLGEQLHADKLNESVCPHCGTAGRLYAPLLIYDPRRDIPLIYSPVPGKVDQWGVEMNKVRLLLHLEVLMGEAWRQDLIDSVRTVPREDLTTVLWPTEELTPPPALNIYDVLREIEQLTHPADMPLRVELCRQALAGVDPLYERDLWVQLQKNLAKTLLQVPAPDRSINVEEALSILQAVLRVLDRRQTPREWSETQMQLGLAYEQRLQGDRSDNLEHAIAAYELALEEVSRDQSPVSWAQLQANLGVAYAQRKSGEHAFNLEHSITALRSSAEVLTAHDMPQLWLAVTMNLGNAYALRVFGDRQENMEEAIAAYQNALGIASPDRDPMTWAQLHMNLGNAYRDRGRPTDLRIAIDHYHQALSVVSRQASPEFWATVHHNLATIYTLLSANSGQRDREQAIIHFNQALEVLTADYFPDECLSILMSLGNLHFQDRSWADAIASYSRAHEISRVRMAAAYTDTGRQSLVADTSQLYSQMAYSLLQMRRSGEALVRLEQGKTRLLVGSLPPTEADLVRLPDNWRQAVHIAYASVRSLDAEMRMPPNAPSRRPEDELGELQRQARSRLDHILNEIDAEYPGFVPADLDLASIVDLVPAGGVLLAPLVTTQGSAVLILSLGLRSIDQGHIVLLDTLNANKLRSVLDGTGEDEGWFSTVHYVWDDGRGVREWMNKLMTRTAWLWEHLMGPVHERLAALMLPEGAPVVLLPQGGLGFLPLHAAWRKVNGRQRYFLDDYTVTYAPRANLLRLCRQRLADTARQGRRLLAAVNPTNDLPYAVLEGQAVASCFGAANRFILSGDGATKAAITGRISGSTHLHFACHNSHEWQYIQDSGLELAGKERLTLAEILSADIDLSSARLVTLSACDTGLTDVRKSMDEFIGLPVGFLQGGAPTVISSLWEVPDSVSTALLMQHFCQQHLQQSMDPGPALRAAQIWVRSLKTEAVVEYAKNWYRQAAPEIRVQLLRYIRNLEHKMGEGTESEPFAHPYYWSGFTVYGS